MKRLNAFLLSLLATPFLIVLLTLSVTTNSYAKDKNQAELDWYQIEVIIFSQQDLFREEKHRTDIELSYPDNIRALVSPSSTEENIEQSAIQKLPLGMEVPSGTKKKTISDQEAFLELSRSALELNDDHKRLNRAPGYRVLYHKAWRQPGLGRKTAPWILIKAGNEYGDHHELEGSIRLVRNRYLHIQADLWKTRFSSATSVSGPANISTTYENSFNTLSSTSPIKPKVNEWPVLPVTPLIVDATATEGTIGEEAKTGESTTKETDGKETVIDANKIETTTTANLHSLKYGITDIVTLKQSSRLTRDELTYLDHPELGVIVLVKKYEGGS